MRKANAAGNLVFVPGNITNVGLVNTNPVIQFDIIAQNTSNTDLLLNSFAGNMTANGTLVGNVSNFFGAVVPANSSTRISLTANMLTLGLVNDIFQAFQNKTGSQVIHIDGHANVNSFQVAVPLDYTVGI